MKKQSALAARLLVCAMLTSLSGCTTSRDWESASKQNSAASYEQFLRKHPHANQAQIAQTRMLAFKAREEWQKTQRENTIEGYQRFLAAYPQSKFTAEAKMQLQAREVWKRVKATENIEAYRKFVGDYPQYAGFAEVRQLLEDLVAERDWKVAAEKDTANAMADFVARHPKSKHAAVAAARVKLTAEEDTWKRALAEDTEAGWLDYISRFWDSPRIHEAVARFRKKEAVSLACILRIFNVDTNSLAFGVGQVMVRADLTTTPLTGAITPFTPNISLRSRNERGEVSTHTASMSTDNTADAFTAQPGKTNLFFCVAGGPTAHDRNVYTKYSGRGIIFAYATRRYQVGIDNRISNLVLIDMDFDKHIGTLLGDEPSSGK